MSLSLPHIFSRWRHGMGFGIHSPFAYRFVTEVLRQEMGYYAYLRMPGDERYRTIFRIILALQPQTVALVGTDNYKRAVREAVPHAHITRPDNADMIIVDARQQTGLDLGRYSGKHAIVLNYKYLPTWKTFKDAMEYGMTFANNGSMAVAVALPHLPRQDYEVKF